MLCVASFPHVHAPLGWCFQEFQNGFTKVTVRRRSSRGDFHLCFHAFYFFFFEHILVPRLSLPSHCIRWILVGIDSDLSFESLWVIFKCMYIYICNIPPLLLLILMIFLPYRLSQAVVFFYATSKTASKRLPNSAPSKFVGSIVCSLVFFARLHFRGQYIILFSHTLATLYVLSSPLFLLAGILYPHSVIFYSP